MALQPDGSGIFRPLADARFSHAAQGRAAPVPNLQPKPGPLWSGELSGAGCVQFL